MLAALFLCLGTQDRIDVRLPAAIGEVMARRLSGLFQVKIQADDTLADVPLIFNVKGVTFDEFRPLAAEGLDAAWKEENGVWVLYRKPEQVQKEEAEFLKRRAAIIKKAIVDHENAKPIEQKDLDDLATSAKFAADDELEELLYDHTAIPDELVGKMVYDALGADYFANLPLDRRYVFTSDGRNGTKKLPVLEEIVKIVQQQRKRVEDAMRKSGAWDRLAMSASGVDTRSLLSRLSVGDVQTMVLEIISTHTAVVVAVSGFDAEGKGTAQYFDSAYVEDDEPIELPVEARTGFVVFSPETLAFHKSFSEGEDLTEEQGLKLYADFLAQFPESDVLQHDISDILFSISDKLGKPMVGRLSDDLVDMADDGYWGYSESDGEQVEMEKIPLQGGVEYLGGYLRLGFGSSLVGVAPTIPKKYQTVFPRKAIGNYVRANRGNPNLDLDRLKNLAVAPTSFDASNRAEIAFSVHGYEGVYRGIDLSLFSTWAEMSSTQRMQASSPQGINLTVSQCSDLLRFEFNSDAVNNGQWSMMPGSLDSDTEEWYEEDVEPIIDWMLYDVGPNAMDRLQVNIKARQDSEVRFAMEGEDPSARWSLSASDLAEWFYMYESEEDKAGLEQIKAAKFSIDQILALDLTYQTPIGPMKMTSSMVTAKGVRDNLSLQQLPPAFLQEFNAALAKLRRGGGVPRAS